MMTNNKEIRAFNFDVKANNNEDHGNFIEGRAIVYDEPTNMGLWDEIIDNGALADTDLKDVRFLINHNTDMIPLARSRNNNENSTMQMSVVDGEGLDIRADLDTENNADAKSLYSATERGDIDGMSFMFVEIAVMTSIQITRHGILDRSAKCLKCLPLPSRHMKRHHSKHAACLMRWIAQKHRWRAHAPKRERLKQRSRKSGFYRRLCNGFQRYDHRPA